MLPQGNSKWGCVQEVLFPMRITSLHQVAGPPGSAARDIVCQLSALTFASIDGNVLGEVLGSLWPGRKGNTPNGWA